jgi:hypothetical protein
MSSFCCHFFDRALVSDGCPFPVRSGGGYRKHSLLAGAGRVRAIALHADFDAVHGINTRIVTS